MDAIEYLSSNNTALNTTTATTTTTTTTAAAAKNVPNDPANKAHWEKNYQKLLAFQEKKRLTDLGFDWTITTLDDDDDNNNDDDHDSSKHYYKKLWDTRFHQLLEFQQKHGHVEGTL